MALCIFLKYLACRTKKYRVPFFILTFDLISRSFKVVYVKKRIISHLVVLLWIYLWSHPLLFSSLKCLLYKTQKNSLVIFVFMFDPFSRSFKVKYVKNLNISYLVLWLCSYSDCGMKIITIKPIQNKNLFLSLFYTYKYKDW